jgi:hypothetical protein
MSLLLQLAAAADTVLVRNVPPVAHGRSSRSSSSPQVMTSILLFLLVCVIVVGLLLLLRAKADELRGQAGSPDRRAQADGAQRDGDVEPRCAPSRRTSTRWWPTRVTPLHVINDRVRASAVKLDRRGRSTSAAMVGSVNASAEHGWPTSRRPRSRD